MRKLLMTLAICVPLGLSAQEGSDEPLQPERRSVSIAAQALVDALKDFERTSQMQVVFVAEDVRAMRSRGAAGLLTNEELLRRLLEGTGLMYRYLDSSTVTILPRGEARDDRAAEAAGAMPLRSERARVSQAMVRIDNPNPSQAEGRVEDRKQETANSEAGEIMVTSTRLRNVETASPRITISREQLERGGYSNVEEVLRNLPQNLSSASGLAQQLFQTEFGASNNQFATFTTLGNSGVNLRGLGSRSSLVLVDGRRKARSSQGLLDGFTDTSSIPIAQIERIEIIADGASAIYGADAVAGVVNIITRKDYEGLNLAARTEHAANGGSLDRVNMGYTFSWGEGKLTTAVNAEQTEPNDLNKLTPVGPNGVGDFTAFGGLDLRRYGVGPAGEGSILQAVVQGTSINAGNHIAGPNPYFQRDANGNITGPRQAGVPSVFDEEDLGPENQRFSIRISGEQGLGDSHTLSFDVAYDEQKDENILGFGNVSFNNVNPLNAAGSLLVPRAPGRPGSQRLNGARTFTYMTAANPNNPYGASRTDGGTPTPILVGYDFAMESAAVTAAQLPIGNRLENLSASLALAGDLPFVNGWRYDVGASLSRENSDGRSYLAPAHFPPFLVNPAFDPLANGLDPFSGTPQAVANNVDLLLAMLETGLSDGENETRQFTAFASGPIFSLPAGESQLAIGVELRESEGASVITTFDYTGALVRDPFVVGPNEESVEAVFAEMSLPLFRDLPAVQELSLRLAARYEEHDRSGFVNASNFNGLGGTVDGIDLGALLGVAGEVTGFERAIPQGAKYSNTSPSVDLIWQVVDDVRVTATWGESFLTPLSSQLYGTVSTFPSAFQLNAFMPLGGQYGAPLGQVITISGSNANLQPQTADTRTVRLIYTPSQVDGLTLSATYSDLDYENYIANPAFFPTATLVENFEALPNVFLLGDTNTLVYDSREQNLSSNTSRTIDFLVEYGFSTGYGDWIIGLNAVRTLETSRQLVESIPEIDIADTERGPSNWAGTLRLSWNQGNVDAALETFYVSAAGMLEPASASTTQGNRFRITDELPVNTNPQSRAPSFVTSNLQVGYSSSVNSGWAEGLRVSVGAQNLFDRRAPFVDNFNGFAANRVSATGRVLYLNLSKDFRF